MKNDDIIKLRKIIKEEMNQGFLDIFKKKSAAPAEEEDPDVAELNKVRAQEAEVEKTKTNAKLAALKKIGAFAGKSDVFKQLEGKVQLKPIDICNALGLTEELLPKTKDFPGWVSLVFGEILSKPKGVVAINKLLGTNIDPNKGSLNDSIGFLEALYKEVASKKNEGEGSVVLKEPGFSDSFSTNITDELRVFIGIVKTINGVSLYSTSGLWRAIDQFLEDICKISKEGKLKSPAGSIKKESASVEEGPILTERWQRLAGIIK